MYVFLSKIANQVSERQLVYPEDNCIIMNLYKPETYV